ncbi:DUF4426 domain-containing protein [Reinekea marina]|uniref:DUF4426 domain-containing protein n=1 Tax=Reinekea marina TaxID=1310421 RepID=A0ABV7WVA8_9GAMM|nr:DUF4426 domain-containing protein [Reinekea marina]MDN3651000.1 DUF4426 domain-containing protein [Reinekea marina]
MKKLLFSIAIVCAALQSFVHAEQKVEFNGYELHYIVLNTTELSPEIAKRYDISRSGKRAFVNLSVLKQDQDSIPFAVEAKVTALQRNLMGQRGDIALRTFKEGKAIYHIGDFLIFDKETIWLDITVDIEGEDTFEFTFPQQVWRN